jgi:hypothetical protein
MATIKNIRTLESIAVGIRDLAIAKAPKAAINGGNLRSKIKSANTPVKSKMIKQGKDLDVTISLDYAPNGAEYGQWFNEPPTPASKRRRSLKKTAVSRGNWNYAIDAMSDDELSRKFDAYLAELGDYFVEQIEIELDKP